MRHAYSRIQPDGHAMIRAFTTRSVDIDSVRVEACREAAPVAAILTSTNARGDCPRWRLVAVDRTLMTAHHGRVHLVPGCDHDGPATCPTTSVSHVSIGDMTAGSGQ